MFKQIFNRSYTDLFDNYEEYHKNIDTNSEIRALEISKMIKDESTILDVGCGDGINAKLIKEKTKSKIIGCDIVDRAKGIIPVLIEDLNEGLDIKQKFDYVIICEVLEHLLRPHKVLQSAAKIAKKGVIVTIPNSGYITFRMQLMFGIFPRQSFTHIHYWTYKDFLYFCNQLGLKVETRKFNPSKGWKTILKKMIPNLFAYQLYFFIAPNRE